RGFLAYVSWCTYEDDGELWGRSPLSPNSIIEFEEFGDSGERPHNSPPPNFFTVLETEENADTRLSDVQCLTLNASDRVTADIELDTHRSGWSQFDTATVIHSELYAEVGYSAAPRVDGTQSCGDVRFHHRKRRLKAEIRVIDEGL